MEMSIFNDKAIVPAKKELFEKIGSASISWNKIEAYVVDLYPDGLAEWNYPGKKYGWSYRIKDKRRAIIYFLPRDGFFKVAFVFGQKAFDCIMDREISNDIKSDLEQTKKYSEGRGIRIKIENEDVLQDICKLIKIKN